MTSVKRDVTKQNLFTYVSLFSGIGGFEQALNKLGGQCVFASEIDRFAVQAYEVLYGHKPAGDITKIDANDVPDHDLLTAGFPCQAFSVAGHRKGFEDTRGTLFFEIARIAVEKKPKALLLENVKGLLNHDKGKTLDIMIETLNEIGYVIDFDVLNSKYFGVPQNRERIFIIAVRDDLIDSEPFNEESMKGNTIVPKRKRQINEWAKTFNFDWPEQTEVTTRLRDILETEVDEKYYLDEEKTAKLVAQLEESDKTVGTVGHHPFSKKYEFKGYNSEISPSLIATDYKAPKTVLEGEPQMLGHIDIKGHDATKRVYDSEGISPTLTTMGGGHREPKIAEPDVKFVGGIDEGNKWLNDGKTYSRNFKQGYRVYDSEGIATSLLSQPVGGLAGPTSLYKVPKGPCVYNRGQLKTNPDGISNVIDANYTKGIDNHGQRTHVIEYSRKVGVEKELDVAHTLNSLDWHGLNRNQKQNAVLKTQPRYRIRKLTPLECWRLQGFPDEAHEAVKQAGISDSQRYKQAGNAVTVNVVEAIAERLIPLITNK